MPTPFERINQININIKARKQTTSANSDKLFPSFITGITTDRETVSQNLRALTGDVVCRFSSTDWKSFYTAPDEPLKAATMCTYFVLLRQQGNGVILMQNTISGQIERDGGTYNNRRYDATTARRIRCSLSCTCFLCTPSYIWAHKSNSISGHFAFKLNLRNTVRKRNLRTVFDTHFTTKNDSTGNWIWPLFWNLLLHKSPVCFLNSLQTSMYVCMYAWTYH